MIPVLVVSDAGRDLTELADLISDFSARDDLGAYVAATPEDAIEVFTDVGVTLMYTILGPQGQATYDALMRAGYRGDIVVCDNPTNKPQWGERSVKFVNIRDGEAESHTYDLLIDALLYG